MKSLAATLLAAAFVVALAACGGASNTKLAAWQRERTLQRIHSYGRLHFACGTSETCRFSIKKIGSNSYEAIVSRHGYRDYCYRVRFFFRHHRFAGPAQPINCV
jgi:hypothetical protein